MADASPPVVRWEYLVLRVGLRGFPGADEEGVPKPRDPRSATEYMEERLNDLGTKGWELVAVGDWVAYFKRRL
jgi:hypothetical protein